MKNIFHLKPEVRVESQINLQLTGKLSLKLDFNSSLLLEYGHISTSQAAFEI